jgi:hypothetical protein
MTTRTAPEIIATHLCSDIYDVKDARYQSTRYVAPAVYSIGNHYFCAPSGSQKCPKPWKWEKVGEYYDRAVFRAHMNDVED